MNRIVGVNPLFKLFDMGFLICYYWIQSFDVDAKHYLSQFNEIIFNTDIAKLEPYWMPISQVSSLCHTMVHNERELELLTALEAQILKTAKEPFYLVHEKLKRVRVAIYQSYETLGKDELLIEALKKHAVMEPASENASPLEKQEVIDTIAFYTFYLLQILNV